MKGLRTLAIGLAAAAVWPSYVGLLAYTARQAPWPRGVAILVAAVLSGLALAVLGHELLRWLARPSGWAECYLGMPAQVARQLSRAGRFLVVAAAALLLPVYLLDQGLVAPAGRPVAAPGLSRFLILAFELAIWATSVRLLRGRSPLLAWLVGDPAGPGAGGTESSGRVAVAADSGVLVPADGSGAARLRDGLVWLSRHRHLAAWLVLAVMGAVILLDVRGYSFSARRLALGGFQTAVVILVGRWAYGALRRAIDRSAGRWVRPRRSWAVALTSAVALRATVRARASAPRSEPAGGAAEVPDPLASAIRAEDLAAGLRRLAAGAITAMGLLAIAWLWELDWALVRSLLGQSLWSLDDQTAVTLGDLAEAAAVLVAGALAWRHMSTLFALTLFHRIPDDPGVRFAVVTLCRYAVLALTAVVALSAVHLDMARIGVVLAALGVGLGFGLQEIVSNFVCGIILLLERPIRIGDVVTVAGTTGRVDRIHIRATTIVNADNQSMIVPNREFITGNLVNWTLKDKVLRVGIKLSVAHGTDPDRVVGLLLAVADRESDVLVSPAPVAVLEGFGDFALQFALYVFVPEPARAAPVRHRLCAAIQQRFAEEGIVIPLPSRDLHVQRLPHDLARALEAIRPSRGAGGGERVAASGWRGAGKDPERGPHFPT
ncbi:MAG TPA: mechanosensitive ion channel domain-containing protein [Isosphaeraceae bacterium]|nr:mechanosensitive ion channel domain-containing protein [Isosphaeraceae bacterium]